MDPNQQAQQQNTPQQASEPVTPAPSMEQPTQQQPATPTQGGKKSNTLLFLLLLLLAVLILGGIYYYFFILNPSSYSGPASTVSPTPITTNASPAPTKVMTEEEQVDSVDTGNPDSETSDIEEDAQSL